MTTSLLTPKVSAPIPSADRKKRVLLIDASSRKRELRAEIMRRLGVEVDSSEEVDAAGVRFDAIGMDKEVEDGTVCCYALQDKVWVHGPGSEPWEVYTVVADADELGKSAEIAAGH